MTRISESMDWCELERLVEECRCKLVYRRARCQHGYTRTEHCPSCDGGYVDDLHTFARGIGTTATFNGQPCIAVSDDGEDVAYIPAKFQARINRDEPIAQLRKLAQPGQTTSIERVIQRIISRLYHRLRSEMMLSDRILHVSAVDVDLMAHALISGDGLNGGHLPNVKPSIRYPGDGSAWITYYPENTTPAYVRIVRA